MIELDTDDTAVRAALEDLAATVARHGGRAAAGARCCARNGALTIHAAPAPGRGERLLEVPELCLPPVDAFAFDVRQDRFAIRRTLRPVADSERAAMDAMLAVYNACGKPAAWRRISPWLALGADQPVLDRLAAGRSRIRHVQTLTRLQAEGATDELLLRHFLGARAYFLKAVSATRAANARPASAVLMPFIDFLNHHFAARPYQLTADGGRAERTLWTFGDQPHAGSRECFVHYNVIDRLDSYLSYGFLDASAPIVASIPLDIALPTGGTLVVQGEVGGAFPGHLPSGARDLRVYMPQVRSDDGGRLSLQRLLIPGADKPMALRRVLRMLLPKALGPTKPAGLRAAVESVECQVLQTNLDYYEELHRRASEALQKAPDAAPPGRSAALRTVQALAEAQRAHLAAYAETLKVTL
jgi:hypothetical protein